MSFATSTNLNVYRQAMRDIPTDDDQMIVGAIRFRRRYRRRCFRGQRLGYVRIVSIDRVVQLGGHETCVNECTSPTVSTFSSMISGKMGFGCDDFGLVGSA